MEGDSQAGFETSNVSTGMKNTFIDLEGTRDEESVNGSGSPEGGHAQQVSEPPPPMYSDSTGSAMNPFLAHGEDDVAGLAAADMVNCTLGRSAGPGGGGGEMSLAMMPDMLAGAPAPPPEWQKKTTVMMRNLPNKYTQRMLLTEINHTGFLGTFDFVYLPIDAETNANKGYAFLNFVDPGFAWMFRMSYEGRKMSRFNSNKVVCVTPATLQGFEANYAHYSNARVNRGDPACRPLFLREPKHQVPGLGQTNAGRTGRRGGRRGGGGLDQLVEAQERQEAIQVAVEQAARQITGPNLPGGSPGGGGQGLGPSSAPSSGGGTGRLVPQFCHHCGSKVQPSFAFCANCGASLAMLQEALRPS